MNDDQQPLDQDETDTDEGTLDDLDPGHDDRAARTLTPYSSAAHRYLAAGWRGVLPLPPRRKSTPPGEYTGEGGAWTSAADVQAFIDQGVHGRRADGTPYHFDAGNIALRLPPDVVGLDVDAYEGKAGALTFAVKLAELGALPPTWVSSSRAVTGDGTSGIRLYRLPVLDGAQVVTAGWPGVLGPGVELIRTGHRYMLVWPSLHPDTGATYAWTRPDGIATLDVPRVEDLPYLPEAWTRHFQDQARAVAGKTTLGPDEAVKWLRPYALELGQVPCALVEGYVRYMTPRLMGQDGGSRHDSMLAATARLVRAATEGHLGVVTALDEVRRTFTAAAGGGGRDVAGEWNRAVLGAVQLAAHAHDGNDTPPDPCHAPRDPLAGLIPPDQKDTPWPSPTAPAPVTSGSATSSSSTTSPTYAGSPTPTAGTTTGPPASISSPSSTSGAATAPPTTSPAGAPSVPAPATPSGTTPDGDLTDEQLARAQATLLAVTYEVDRLRIRHEAAGLFADELRRKTPPAPFDVGTLAQVLARPPEPPMRADGLVPWEGSMLLVAKRKSGKTTLLLNYAKALLDGTDFLGRFPVVPVTGRIALVNYEVSGAQLARWADEHGLDRDRLYLVNLRGRRNPLADPADQAELAEIIRAQECETVIVDPFGRAFTGAAQNDAGEVGQWLVNLDYFARTECGAKDLVLAAHAGWNGERTRGSSALEDWADTIVTLTRDEDDDAAPAYLRAMGRDVDVDEDALDFDRATRTLTLAGSGGRRANRKSRDLEPVMGGIVQALEAGPHTGVASLESALKAASVPVATRGMVGQACTELVRRGLVLEGVGARNARVFTLNTVAGATRTVTPPHPPAPPRIGGPDPPAPPYRGAGGSGGPQRVEHRRGGHVIDGHTGEVRE